VERAALITGGSSGIGLAVARALGRDGYGVTISGRRPDKLEAAADGLCGEGVEVCAVPANMAIEEDVQALARSHEERFGRLDVLMNNAGVGIGEPIEHTRTKMLDMQLDVNLRGTYLMTRECIPMLRRAGGEHRGALIVNSSSISGRYGQGWIGAYSATKAGVLVLSQSMHKELAASGIHVTALLPGYVDTPMTDWVKEQVPPEEMIRPDDIAEAVRFLLRLSPACIVPELAFIRPSDTQP
jgi:NAD(P)-dependent dehydrogenase (short-subunit alcohol dehydrogenase family)